MFRHGRAVRVIIAALRSGSIFLYSFCFAFYLVLLFFNSSDPHEFAAVPEPARRGPVRNNAPHHGEGHDLHQDLCGRLAVSHQRRVAPEIFRDFRRHRRSGRHHGQTDGQVPRIRLCEFQLLFPGRSVRGFNRAALSFVSSGLLLLLLRKNLSFNAAIFFFSAAFFSNKLLSPRRLFTPLFPSSSSSRSARCVGHMLEA